MPTDQPPNTMPADLVLQAAAYVRNLFAQADTSKLFFHSIGHTEDVVRRAIEIGRAERVTEDELAILQIAAWFHDVGHLNGGIHDHELRSIDAFNKFLEA